MSQVDIRAKIRGRDLSPTTYYGFGLSFSSELALPEFQIIEHEGAADVSIYVGAPHPIDLPGAEQVGPFLWIISEDIIIEIPSIAQFFIRGGREISIAPEPGVDDDSIRAFLFGSALGALLFQRGDLVLHGNSIRIGNEALVCVGPAGSGKSTLAAGFHARGFDVFADDVVLIDQNGRTVPGVPRLKLWEDVIGQLDIDLSRLRRIRPNISKYSYPIFSRYSGEGLPVRWIYVLTTEYRHEVMLEPVEGIRKFQQLRSNTYRVRMMESMQLQHQHLQLCAKLADHSRVSMLYRPRDGFPLDEMVDCILTDVGEVA